MNNERNNGYYWSASPYNATYGYYLNFNSTGASPQNNSQRGLGVPVRCVQE